MSAVDDYLATVGPERRRVLAHMVEVIRRRLPDAVETTSYNMPAFKVGGKAVIGFLAHKQHMALYPHSGWVIEQLRDRLEGYSLSSGTIRFTEANPVPDELLEEIIAKRLEQLRA